MSKSELGEAETGERDIDARHDLSHRFESDSVSRTMELVGERWTMLLLKEAFFGVRRYSQLVRNLGIPRPTLTARLRKLVDADLLERVLYARDPDRFEYRLTAAGRDLFAAIVVLMQWGDQHLAGPQGPPIVLTHDRCGHDTHPRLTCDVCGEEIVPQDVTPRRGDGYDISTSARPGRGSS